MNCDDIRTRLTASTRSESALALIGRHLAECPACAAFAHRVADAQQALNRHHAGIEPDAGFAARVVAALPQPQAPLTWAAMRLLPAALALVLVLAGWVLIDSSRPSTVADQSPTDDLLGWVLHETENGS